MGGFDGGCISLLSLLTCRGLHLCGSCLLMLLLFGFRGRLFLSSFAPGWARSLRVSEDSSMYARFSPKKSSSWQLGEEAAWRGGEGRTIEWRGRGQEGGGRWKRACKPGAGANQWLLSTEIHFSARISLSFSCAVFMSAALALPSSMLPTVRQGW